MDWAKKSSRFIPSDEVSRFETEEPDFRIAEQASPSGRDGGKRFPQGCHVSRQR